ncbi:MAG TPA: TetR/AcrR family transcriptional regulator [Puia sp.]|nr:TetR/AcrR family transcriptional regulator [Puia sp.]
MSDLFYFRAMITTDISVREQIIETADRLFYKQGYNLTGINQIIEEAEVAKASLYYHFPSKEDLCVAYLKRRYEKWLVMLTEFLMGITEPRECIIKCFECRSEYLLENDFSGCSYIRIIAEMPQRSAKINKQAILNKEKQRQFFIDKVKEFKRSSGASAMDLANTIFLLFDGATVQCQVYRELWPIKNAIKALKNLL